MPSKRENLEQLLDKNLSKTPDQARRESQSISSILQRFGGPVSTPESPLPPSDTDIRKDETVPEITTPPSATPELGIPIISIPNIGIPESSVPNVSTPVITTPRQRNKERETSVPFQIDAGRGWLA